MAVFPIVSLCTGGGGLDRGLELGLGDSCRVQPVLYVEREAFAAAYLAAEMEAGRLAQTPIWSDLTTIPDDVLRKLRDVAPLGVIGGFPCQPWSAAGQRKGVDDDRWLWDDIARILREVRPEFVFLENMPGLARGGLEHVLATLAEIGLDAEWGCFRASEVGAPHRRERLFVLGYSDNSRLEGWYERGLRGGKPPARARGAAVADPAGILEREPHDETSAVPRQRSRAGTDWGGCGFPPGPSGDWSGVHPALWPALAAEEEAELEVRGVADGLALATSSRADTLRLLGNGVVPAQAALAFRKLAARS